MKNNMSPQAVKQWKNRNLTDANLRLNRIADKLKDADEEVQAWLERHGEDCPCHFCVEVGEQTAHDLRWLAYGLEMGISVIGGSACQLKPGQLAEAQKRMDREQIEVRRPAMV